MPFCLPYSFLFCLPIYCFFSTSLAFSVSSSPLLCLSLPKAHSSALTSTNPRSFSFSHVFFLSTSSFSLKIAQQRAVGCQLIRSLCDFICPSPFARSLLFSISKSLFFSFHYSVTHSLPPSIFLVIIFSISLWGFLFLSLSYSPLSYFSLFFLSHFFNVGKLLYLSNSLFFLITNFLIYCMYFHFVIHLHYINYYHDFPSVSVFSLSLFV